MSTAVLVAEMVAHFYPKLVELHNYQPVNSSIAQLYNWSCLNKRVFRKLGFVLSKAESEAVCTCQPGAVERVLKLLQACTACLCLPSLLPTITKATASAAAAALLLSWSLHCCR